MVCSGMFLNFSVGTHQLLTLVEEVSLEYVRFDIYDPVKIKCLAARNQYPIKLAYALTVHPAQGMTLSKVELDCDSFVAPG